MDSERNNKKARRKDQARTSEKCYHHVKVTEAPMCHLNERLWTFETHALFTSTSPCSCVVITWCRHDMVSWYTRVNIVCTFASNDTGKNGNTYSQLTSYIVTVILSMQACVLTSLKQASLKAAWNRCASCLRKGLNNVRSKWASRRHQR